MKNALATLALAAVPALILSACNGNAGGSGVAPTVPNAPAASSHHRHMRGADNGPQDLHAGGSTFAAYAYNLGNQPTGTYNSPQAPPGQGSLFYAAPTQGTIYYCLTGSGFGRAAFESNNGTTTTGMRTARRHADRARRPSRSARFRRQRPGDFIHRVLRDRHDVRERTPHGFGNLGAAVRVSGFRRTDQSTGSGPKTSRPTSPRSSSPPGPIARSRTAPSAIGTTRP